MKLSVIERRLRAGHSLPQSFLFYKWECFPDGRNTIYVQFTGAVVEHVYKSGPRKGKPNFNKATQQQEFHVTVEQGLNWEQEYEQETGNCVQCEGTGQTIKSVGKDGATNRPCSRCAGSGQKPSRGLR